jgi:hypothetical protein
MPVYYDGVSIRPAPRVAFSQEIRETADGRRLGSGVVATLTGQITATKTDDTESAIAIEGRLASIIHKQAALRAVFANDGRFFEVQGYDGSSPVKFNARVRSINFDEGIWIDVCSYTIVLEGTDFADEEQDDDYASIESASEGWSFEEGEGPHTYRVTHNLSAKGKVKYDANGVITAHAWETAKSFVTTQLKLSMNATATPWSTTAGATIFGNSAVEPDAAIQFNRVISENLDELEGTYNVTENYFVALNNFWEEFTVSVRRVTGEPFFGSVAAIQGSIHGLYVNLHDIETKLVNAKAYWLSLEPMLYARVSAYAADITLNSHPTTSNVDYNYNEGLINYSYEYNDRVNTNDTTESFNVSMQTSNEDGRTTVTLEGLIRGEQYLNEAFDIDLKYTRALARYNVVKLLALSRCVTETGLADLRAFPVSAVMSPNKLEGTISYTFVFDNRVPLSVKDEFSVSTRYSREDGKTFVTVEGTMTGYRTANATDPFVLNDIDERYENALAYFEAAEPNFLGLAATYVDTTKVNPTPYSKQVAHHPRAGQVTYNYEYNSIPAPCFPDALSEIITVTNEAATSVIAIVPVLGRAAGPIFQNTGTVKEKRRSLSIELVLPTDGTLSNCELLGEDSPTYDVTSYAPTGTVVYLDQNVSTWSPTTGRFTLQVSWIWQ